MSQNNTAGELIKVVEAHIKSEWDKISTLFNEYDLYVHDYCDRFEGHIEDICDEVEEWSDLDLPCPNILGRGLHSKVRVCRLRSDTPHNREFLIGWEINSDDYDFVKFVGIKQIGRSWTGSAYRKVCDSAKEANKKLDELNQLLEYTKRVTQHEQH